MNVGTCGIICIVLGFHVMDQVFFRVPHIHVALHMALDLALAPAQRADDAKGQDFAGPQVQPLPRVHVPKAECREHVAEEVALILRRALVHGVRKWTSAP